MLFYCLLSLLTALISFSKRNKWLSGHKLIQFFELFFGTCPAKFFTSSNRNCSLYLRSQLVPHFAWNLFDFSWLVSLFSHSAKNAFRLQLGSKAIWNEDSVSKNEIRIKNGINSYLLSYLYAAFIVGHSISVNLQCRQSFRKSIFWHFSNKLEMTSTTVYRRVCDQIEAWREVRYRKGILHWITRSSLHKMRNVVIWTEQLKLSLRIVDNQREWKTCL